MVKNDFSTALIESKQIGFLRFIVTADNLSMPASLCISKIQNELSKNSSINQICFLLMSTITCSILSRSNPSKNSLKIHRVPMLTTAFVSSN